MEVLKENYYKHISHKRVALKNRMSRTSNYRVSCSVEVEIQCVGDLFTGLRKK